MQNPIENPQSLPTVVVEVAEKPKVNEPSLPIIGFHLSKLVLIIISGFIAFLVLMIFAKSLDATNSIQIPTDSHVPDSSFQKKLELAKMIQEEKKNFRDFIFQIAQMVLLNLLLPVLTAILGYIFASNKHKE